MKILDRIFSVLVIVGGVGHAAGVFVAYRAVPMQMLWSLSASLFALLLGSLHLLRIGRPLDRAITLVCLAGTLCWLGITVAFGLLIHNFADPRVLFQGTLGLALSAICLRSLVAPPPGRLNVHPAS